MHPIAKAITLIGILIAAHAARAAPADEARALYDHFVAAQNSHDFAAVQSVLLDSPEFLWVTDGRSIWGREAAIARMASYHTNEIWNITPDMTHARAITVNQRTAYLSVPLTLRIGSAASSDQIRFLVSALCTDTPQGWKIAALFTTLENPNK